SARSPARHSRQRRRHAAGGRPRCCRFEKFEFGRSSWQAPAYIRVYIQASSNLKYGIIIPHGVGGENWDESPERLMSSILEPSHKFGTNRVYSRRTRHIHAHTPR